MIMLSVVGKAGTVVDAMNLGAADYINKPFEEEELEIALKKVLEIENLKGEREELRDRLRAHEARERTSFLWASREDDAHPATSWSRSPTPTSRS